MNEEQREREIQHLEEAPIEEYHTVEVVAIPPDFDINMYLSLREGAGIFESKDISLKQLQIISEAVKFTPIFVIQNNLRISAVTCMFYLKVINEIGLTLKSIPNPFRDQIERYIEIFDKKDDVKWVHDQRVKRVNFTILNVFPLMDDDVIKEVMEIANKLQQKQKEFSKKLKSLNFGGK
jgi:hypothetical protein